MTKTSTGIPCSPRKAGIDGRSKEKILLADDDPQLRDMLGKFLRDQGYAVRAAADGLEALKALQEEEFHLALLDLGHAGRFRVGAALPD